MTPLWCARSRKALPGPVIRESPVMYTLSGFLALNVASAAAGLRLAGDSVAAFRRPLVAVVTVCRHVICALTLSSLLRPSLALTSDPGSSTCGTPGKFPGPLVSHQA